MSAPSLRGRFFGGHPGGVICWVAHGGRGAASPVEKYGFTDCGGKVDSVFRGGKNSLVVTE
jgi:hypothetical protein